MKFTSLLIALLTTTFSFSQEINVKVSGMIFSTGQDSIFISQVYGNAYTDHIGTKLSKDGKFKFETPLPFTDYYVLRFGQNHINLILRENSEITVYGDGANINEFTNIIGSEETAAMNQYLKLVNNWNVVRNDAMAQIQADPTKKQAVDKATSDEFTKFRGEQQKFVSVNQNSAALYPVLAQVDIANDFASYEAIVKQLVAGFGESPTVKAVEANYIKLRDEKAAKDPLGAGKEAPDFEEMKLDGTTMKLSDLRGSIVLLDFWASWCRPCRAENPTVVKSYEKYSEEGFTVMSVSLDKSKEAWAAAIEKDGLLWPNHVSDLKQWSSRVAKIYGVHGIPFTVLIDRDGKIIGTKLRGQQLEQELHRIFGH